LNPNTDARLRRRGGPAESWLAFGVVLFVLFVLTVPAAAQAHRYLLVGVPGSKGDTVHTGVSLLVFDVDRSHRLVTEIPVWPRQADPEFIRGMVLAPRAPGGLMSDAPRLYVSTTRRLGAVDLASGAVIWERDYGGDCCEQVAVSPDGTTVYAPAFGRARWYVVDAATGALKATVPVVGWPRSTQLSPDGERAFLVAWESRELLVLDTAAREITLAVGPFSAYLCPFTTNRRATMAYANVDRLVGFEVGDLLTGLVIERVQIDDYPPEQLAAYECPSHGIAFGPDDKELWVADGVGNRLRIFDSTQLPPVLVASIQLDRQPRWITFGLDGRYVYSSTGDVVDAASRRVVATLKDEGGHIVESERMVAVSMASPAAGWSR